LDQLKTIQFDHYLYFVMMIMSDVQYIEVNGQQQFQNYTPSQFRQAIRECKYSGPTNGICTGYMQCHLVVLDISFAMDFILFCQRNAQTFPLLEICTGAATTKSYIPKDFASSSDIDLRTDLPKYSIYRNGEWEQHVTDITDIWPESAVAFLIGSSFSYDGSLIDAGIPLRSVNASKNVPYYVTNVPCQPAGPFHGSVVVSMMPIPCTKVAQHILITQEYPYINGTPICVGGEGNSIGVQDINTPDYGDRIEYDPRSDVPVFHMCGATMQNVFSKSNVPFVITSACGCMLVTDRPTPEFM
jgi:uncharacterized protein YcsI (UPF0317 family)